MRHDVVDAGSSEVLKAGGTVSGVRFGQGCQETVNRLSYHVVVAIVNIVVVEVEGAP